MTTMGEAIANARKPRTQSWLAEQMGVWQGTVSDWERNKINPNPEAIPKLERVLGLPAGYLLSIRTGQPFKASKSHPQESSHEEKELLAAIGELTDENRELVRTMLHAMLAQQRAARGR